MGLFVFIQSPCLLNCLKPVIILVSDGIAHVLVLRAL